MKCRSDCGVRYIAPSAFSPIPGMPDGKPANMPCVQLDESLRCKIFASPLQPKACGGLQPSAEMCGWTMHQAMIYLIELGTLTAS